MVQYTYVKRDTQSVLTRREQQIFSMLLEGFIPKEIVSHLNITPNTLKTHQKNIYRKLNVNSIRKLLLLYSSGTAKGVQSAGPMPPNEDKPSVFYRWFTNKDNLGSTVKITEKIEQIEDRFFTTITLAGKLVQATDAYAGVFAFPDPPTLEAMKKAKYISFKVLGDGNSYAVMLPTSNTRLNSGNNHYHKLFATQNSAVSTITVNVSEFTQSPLWGNPVPFKKKDIEFFQIHAQVTEKFNLKIWDIRFY